MMEQHHIELMFAAIGFVVIMLTTQSFLMSVIVFAFWVVFYKYVFKSLLCPTMSLKSKGVMRLSESGDVEGLRRELAKGLSINTRDENNSTFLHWAAANAQVEMAEFLVKNGININAVNNNNCTALHVTSALDRLEIARLLVENGANKDIRSKDDKTPLDCAVSNPMKILLQGNFQTAIASLIFSTFIS